ncbi:hypothetical protein E2C01_048768 [Portunus trituberculatus]|uniref:Uncharacterized protein n=1 Tax=Portunus trituberculatus TaxID=210409 RepID=A0A5B7GB15_PORTR|nr:hypothetical protein [Portunus trituberculatus]
MSHLVIKRREEILPFPQAASILPGGSLPSSVCPSSRRRCPGSEQFTELFWPRHGKRRSVYLLARFGCVSGRECRQLSDVPALLVVVVVGIVVVVMEPEAFLEFISWRVGGDGDSGGGGGGSSVGVLIHVFLWGGVSFPCLRRPSPSPRHIAYPRLAPGTGVLYASLSRQS